MSERIGTLDWDNRRLRGMLDVERQRVDRLRRSMSTMPTATRSRMTQDAINELIATRVEEALQATVGVDAAYAMTWKALMKLMTEVYCPRNEIQKMETELWNLTVKEEEDQVEKYIRGLPDNIQGNVIAAEPVRLQDAICIANNLMDQKLKGDGMLEPYRTAASAECTTKGRVR
ncbi:hypothetical protein Tco_0214330 [Tanacetum coccineum]